MPTPERIGAIDTQDWPISRTMSGTSAEISMFDRPASADTSGAGLRPAMMKRARGTVAWMRGQISFAAYCTASMLGR